MTYEEQIVEFGTHLSLFRDSVVQMTEQRVKYAAQEFQEEAKNSRE